MYKLVSIVSVIEPLVERIIGFFDIFFKQLNRTHFLAISNQYDIFLKKLDLL